MSELLTDKDKARLAKVKAMLEKGENPYHLDFNPQDSRFVKTSTPEVRALSVKARLKKWHDSDKPVTRSRKGRILRTYKGRHPAISVEGLLCIVCGCPVDFTKSTLGTVFLGLKDDSRIVKVNGHLVEEMYKIPLLKTGRACDGCKDQLVDVKFDPTDG